MSLYLIFGRDGEVLRTDDPDKARGFIRNNDAYVVVDTKHSTVMGTSRIYDVPIKEAE